MHEPAPAIDVSSTLAVLARTLDSNELGEQLGLSTIAAPGSELSAELGELELSGDARYGTLRTLGSGGMGRVDAVWDRDLMRELALKQLHRRLAQDGLTLRQFLWEARITAHLDHPNIVPVHDLGLDEQGQLYFTMKRVRGRSLAELCDELEAVEPARFAALDCCHMAGAEPGEDPLIAEYGPRRRRLRIFVEVCQAIAYAHDRGILHHDLKPANVMIGEFGEVLVMDWGLARPIPSRSGEVEARLRELMPEALHDSDGKLRGTPRYMAPELLLGEEPDERTDIYALGVMLYELLALRGPFEATSVPALVMQITEGEPTPLVELAPRVPSSLVAVVGKAMARDREERYASVAALIEDVEAVLAGLTPVAEEASMATKVRRYFWSRDNPDISHVRLVDLDLTGAAGLAMGAALAMAFAPAIEWLATALAILALGLIAVPMRSYARALRSGHRRLERDLRRQREGGSA